MAFLLLIIGVIGLQGPAPLRSTSPVLIQGVVLRAGTNEPIARAVVTMTREAARSFDSDASAASTAANSAARVLTDESGKFEIRVPAGRYTLSASKDGF